jgi:hypothetical protein
MRGTQPLRLNPNSVMKLRIQFVSVLTALTGLGLAAPSFAGDGNWYPSKWGAEDEIGALNELKPQHVVVAASLVKTGKVYSLGIEVNKDTPAYQHRNFRLLLTQPGHQGGKTAGPNKFSLNDEHIEGWLGLRTQINGLEATSASITSTTMATRRRTSPKSAA